jgi:hypothetical protein
VFLYNIDDLQSIVKENLAPPHLRGRPRRRHRREEVDRFKAWMQSREVVPTVIALRQRFEGDPAGGAGAAGAEAGVASAGGARAGGRGHTPDRGKAAPDADGTFERGRRRGPGRSPTPTR